MPSEVIPMMECDQHCSGCGTIENVREVSCPACDKLWTEGTLVNQEKTMTKNFDTSDVGAADSYSDGSAPVDTGLTSRTTVTSEIKTHHDGFGLNDEITITKDEASGPGGASHCYRFEQPFEKASPSGGEPAVRTQRIEFQKGPRFEPGSVAGITEATLLAVLIDRATCFQAGPFACAENAEALQHLQAADAAYKARATSRAARGALGTYKV